MNAFYLSIGIISSIVWILVPFFQRRSNYIYYFVVIAFSAAYGLFFIIIPISIPTRTLIAIDTLTILGLYRVFFRKHIYEIIIIGILLFAISHFIEVYTIQSISTGLNVVLLFAIYFQLYKQYKLSKSFSRILLIIMFYELLTAIKLSFLLINPYGLLIYYYIITIAQIFVGIFLLFIKENYSEQTKNL